MWTCKEVNARSCDRQQGEQNCRGKRSSSRLRQNEHQGEGEGDDHSAAKNYSGESVPTMETRNRYIVEPLPRIPRLSMHGGGEWIYTSDRMGRENQFSIADVPACAGIAEQARGKAPHAERKQKYEK